MAAPTFVQANAGWVVTTGSGNGTLAGTTAGNLIVLQLLCDGTASQGSFSVAGGSNLESLDGTDNSFSTLSGFVAVGGASEAFQRMNVGRSLGGTVTVTATVGAAGNDIYCLIYEFTDVNTGTTLSDIIENTTAGTVVNGTGTGITVSDTAVTTIGDDRLACNFIAVNDDNALVDFTGETGGDWTVAASFGSATGTDGEVGLQTAAMPTAGTIDGGTYTQASDAWGVLGFALIGTTVAAAFVARPIDVTLQSNTPSTIW